MSEKNAINLDTLLVMKMDANPLKRKRDDLSDLEQNTLGLNILPPDVLILKLIGSYLNPNAIFNLTRTPCYLHILPSKEDTKTPRLNYDAQFLVYFVQ